MNELLCSSFTWSRELRVHLDGSEMGMGDSRDSRGNGPG